ncbi:MAG: hypothetical protein H7Z12_07290 [Rhodospirillaceae bacterium]|nr:hypothetical protein [Rhodospirillales bacterium]
MGADYAGLSGIAHASLRQQAGRALTQHPQECQGTAFFGGREASFDGVALSLLVGSAPDSGNFYNFLPGGFMTEASEPKIIWWSEHHSCGDIIFTLAPGWAPWVNRIAQFLLRGRFPRHSHVMLCIWPGLYIHSDKPGGVITVRAEEANLFKKYKRVTVFRNQEWSANVDLSVKILHSATFHLKKGYNSGFFLSRLVRSLDLSRVFCSELIARVFAERGLGDSLPSRPFFCLPVDFERKVKVERWQNVTERYRTAEDHSTQGWMVRQGDSRDSVLSNAAVLMHFSMNSLSTLCNVRSAILKLYRLVSTPIKMESLRWEDARDVIGDIGGRRYSSPLLSGIASYLVGLQPPPVNEELEDLRARIAEVPPFPSDPVLEQRGKGFWFQPSNQDIDNAFRPIKVQSAQISEAVDDVLGSQIRQTIQCLHNAILLYSVTAPRLYALTRFNPDHLCADQVVRNAEGCKAAQSVITLFCHGDAMYDEVLYLASMAEELLERGECTAEILNECIMLLRVMQMFLHPVFQEVMDKATAGTLDDPLARLFISWIATTDQLIRKTYA